ncbi:MAG: DUF4139 domain-containing protein [Bacteroidetes bacterium]|nr:DUF4139 domain-containing protein [Bacteroidota bacterium]
MQSKIFIPLLILPLQLISGSNETVQEVSTQVKSVIIYLDGAELAHSAQVNLEVGRNRVIFTGLSPKLVSKSVQVTAPEAVTVLSVSDRINYLAKQLENQRIKQLKDSVNFLKENLVQLKDDRDAYETEKKMLIVNQSIGGQDKGVAMAELKIAADFYRSRIKEINSAVSKIETQEKKQREILDKVTSQLYELNAKYNPPTAEVSILLAVTSKTAATLEIKYLITGAGWSPLYDLRAEDVDKPIELKYRANVFNNSGFDWNNVKFKLSTADPMQSAAQPRLEPWYLDYEQPVYGYSKGQYDIQQKEGYTQNVIIPQQQLLYEGKSVIMKDSVEFAEIMVSELSAEFDIKEPYTIPSDAKPYIVDITTHTLPASYQHFSVPKIDRDAFLLARITGWEDLDLVEGPAKVYYGNTFVGNSYIYTRSVDDTLNLSLGRDGKILVTRSKLKDFSSTKFIGSTKKETYAYEIGVKNNRKGNINIEIQDQIPISKQGDISVEVLETSGAKTDAVTGQLTWNFNLAPGEAKKITLSFSIKYPKNKTVNTKRYKRKMRANF